MQARSSFSAEELTALDTLEKIIIWGFPIDSHTHSYIHACWVRTFRALGKDVYWFHDDDFKKPEEFSYERSLFITEGYADKNIPIIQSSAYFVHNAVYPQKYLRSGARLIEIRFNLNEIHDVNNDFKLDDGTHALEAVSQDTYYEVLRSNSDMHKEFTGPVATPMNYECVYLLWATDLFPWEINLEDAIPMNKPVVHFVGTEYGNHRQEKFKQTLVDAGVQWISHDPWKAPVSFEENRRFVRESILTADFRPESSENDIKEYGFMNGKNHLAIGYIPCRLFKNISYGSLPLTDSPHAHALLGDAVIFDTNMDELIQKGLAANQDIERKKRAMKMIADRHTYIHRARDLMRCLLKPRPERLIGIAGTWSQITVVTSLINIGREQVDGRKFSDYTEWFSRTLLVPAPMIVYCEPELMDMVKRVRQSGPWPTKIVPQNLYTMPLAWSVPLVETIQGNSAWKATRPHPNDLTNRCPGYPAVTHSKMAWMLNAIEENPFKTDMFFWIDAGLSRFWKGFDPRQAEPNIRTVRDLRKYRKIYAQVGGFKNHVFERMLGRPYTADEVVGTNECMMMAGFFGGHAEPMKKFCESILYFYVNEMIQKNRIDNEQSSMIIECQKNMKGFVFIAPDNQFDYYNFLVFASGSQIPV
jgi:hypothetical protein